MIVGFFKVMFRTLSSRPGYSSGRCIGAAMTGRSRAEDNDFAPKRKRVLHHSGDSPMLHPERPA